MATETLTEPTNEPAIEPTNVVAAYTVTGVQVAALVAKYKHLVVTDLGNHEQVLIVRAARLDIRDVRIKVEKRRKVLKAKSLEEGRLIDSVAEQLSTPLEEVEAHLQAEEDKVVKEMERLEREADNALRIKIQERIDALFVAGCVVSFEAAAAMSEEAYSEGLGIALAAQKAKREQEAERLRIQAEEDAKRKAEAEKLAAERAELDRQRQEQDAERSRRGGGR